MGRKDHLGTPDEAGRRRQRELKKVTSTAYIGNPPVFTEGLDQVGLKARTTGEVRDTDFPVLFDIDDQTENYKVDNASTNLTYNIDLSLQEAHFHRLIIADEDVDTNSITNIDVIFQNLPKNKELQFTIEWIKDPGMVTTPTITFSPTLEGAPAQPSPFPDDFDVYYFLISGRTLPDNTTRYELLNLGTGSGGGNTFPILYPEETIGSIGGPTQNINISGSDGQFKEFTLTGNVNLTFSNFPSATVLEEFWILVNQDGTGGWTLTATGSTLKNAGTLNSLVDKAANSQTLLHFATGDAGTTLHGELVDLVASGGGFSGNLSDLVIDVNKDWNEKSITNLAGLDLFTTVANSVTNASTVTFISNAAVSRGQIGRSDFFGTAQGLTLNITANDNFVFSVDTVQKVKFDDTADLITTEYDLNMAGQFIENIGYLESNTPLRPGDGFVRMAAVDEVKWRNPGDSDDIFLGVGNDSLANESFQVTIASGIQFTVSGFNVDVVNNNIINTGFITPAAGAQQVGESGNAYNEMWAQYFRPESAAATTKHGYTQVGTNRQLISFDSGTADSGFGLYRDGVQRFLFSQPFGNVYEFFIGRDPFLAGEEYRIQLGENSGSSARIFMIEGGGNDLILDRQGVGTTRGVQLRAAGLSTFIATNIELKAFSPFNFNSQEINNVGQVKADTSGTSQFGEFQPSNGGFDYLVRDRISWDTDPDTYIEFATAGISVVSDDDVIIASGFGDNVVIASDQQMNIFVTNGSGLTLTIGGGFPKYTFQDNAFITQEEIFMSSNKIVSMADPTSPQDAATKAYVDSVAGGGGSGGSNLFAQVVKEFSSPAVINSTTLQDDAELKFTAVSGKTYYIEFNLKVFSSNAADIKFGMSIPGGATYQMAKATFDDDFTDPPTSSGNTTISFSTGTGDPASINFFVIVEVGGTGGTVNLSYAQNSAQPIFTTVQRASLMRAYEEGTGGAGAGATTDHVLGTPDLTEFWVEDTGKDWIGIDNGINDLNIILPTTEPAGFTNSYTINSDDFPDGALGWSFDAFGVLGTWTIENVGAAASFEAKLFINGREFANQGFGISTWAAASGWTTIEDVKSGDTISIKAWSTSASTDLRLRQRGIYTFPKAIRVTAKSCTLTTSPDDTNEFIGTLPDNVTAILDRAEVFEYYLTNDQIWDNASGEPNFEPYNFGDVMIRMVTGETARVSARDRTTFTGGANNDFPAPYWNYPFGRYRTTAL